jgi:hypothetical protein
MNCIDKNTYISEFENKILNSENKNVLLSILDSRLNGNFELGCITADNKSFNFEKKLNDEQKYYLQKFDEYYFPEKLIEQTNYDMFIKPIINRIKENNLNVRKFLSVKPENIKKAFLYLSKYGKVKFDLNTNLEFSLLVLKLFQFEKILISTFNPFLEEEFKITNFISIKNPITFSEFYHEIYRYITKIFENKINLIIEINKKTNLNSEKIETQNQIEYYYTIFRNCKSIINALFWIIYANEFKFINNVQSKYEIDDRLIEEFDIKMVEWFKISDVKETENNINFEEERDILGEVYENIEKSEANLMKLLEKILDEQGDNIDENMIDEITDKYINSITNNSEEKELYKYMFCVEVEIFKLIHIQKRKLNENLLKNIK